MTDELRALSEKATKGDWEVQEPIDIGLMIVEAGKEAYEWRGIADLLFPDDRDDIPRKQVIANAAFIVALVNAYRTGHLTVADPAAIAASEARGREAERADLSGWAKKNGMYLTADKIERGEHLAKLEPGQ